MSGAPLFTLVIFMKVDGRQHFITLLMFVLNFVLFFNLFTVANNFITLLMLVLNFAF